MDVGDVGALPEDRFVAGNRQAVAENRTAEVTDFHEIKPPRADAELDIHRGIPGVPAVGQGFRGKRGPADVAAAFTP